MRLPEILYITGTIAAIKDLANLDYELIIDYKVLTIQCFDGHIETVRISKNKFFDLLPIIFIGNIVSVEMNINIEDETYFIDEDGDEIPHEDTFNSFRNMVSTMPINLFKGGVPDFIIKELLNQRNEYLDIISKTPRFYQSGTSISDELKEQRISILIAKRDTITNPILKSGYDSILKKLGYVEPVNSSLKDETDMADFYSI